MSCTSDKDAGAVKRRRIALVLRSSRKEGPGSARTEGTGKWNTVTKTDGRVGMLSSASDIYFGHTFLVSGQLAIFCRDLPCFKQKYGTTSHVHMLVRTWPLTHVSIHGRGSCRTTQLPSQLGRGSDACL